MVERLQDGRRLAGVGARRDQVGAVALRDAGGVHQCEPELGELPPQQRFGAVRVQHVRRVPEERVDRHRGGVLEVVDDGEAGPLAVRQPVVAVDPAEAHPAGQRRHLAEGDLDLRRGVQRVDPEPQQLRQCHGRGDRDEIVHRVAERPLLALPPQHPVGDREPHQRQRTDRDQVRNQVVHAEALVQQQVERAAHEQRGGVHGHECHQPGGARVRRPGVAEDEPVGEQEQPQRRDLRGEHEAEQAGAEPEVVEHRQGELVDDDAGQPDQREPAEPLRGGGDAQARHEPRVAGRLAHRRLAGAGVPLAEVEADLARPQAGRAEQDLEQDLEAVGPQRGEVDRLAADDEEAGQRVADRRAGDSGNSSRVPPIRSARRPAAAGSGRHPGATREAAREHEVELVLARHDASSRWITDGGCCRSPSITHT